MAAPAIPPLRLGLTGTGLAVEKPHRPALRRLADQYVVTAFTDRSAEQGRRFADPEIPVPPEPDDMRLYGTEGVLAGSESERRVTRSSSDATTHTTVFRGIDHGYRAELVGFADAVQLGVRPVGSVAQGVADAMVVQRALDPVPGTGPAPLWRPRGSTGLFDGLPGQRISSSASFAA